MSEACSHRDDIGWLWENGRCMFCHAIEPGSELDRLRQVESKIARLVAAFDEIEAWAQMIPSKSIATVRAILVEVRGVVE